MNPYSFQIEYHNQLPENITIEILSFQNVMDITQVPINFINAWLRQEAEIWNWTDGTTYE